MHPVKYDSNNAYPIRVLCVFSTLDRGGAETMCMNLYRHIDREKVQFDFVKHTNEKCAFDDEIESLGGHIYVAPRFKGYNLIQYQSWWKNHLRKHPEHQIIHGHYFTLSALYFSIAKQLGRITIGHSHIAKFDSDLKRQLCKRVEIYADYCFACGREAGQLLFPRRHFIVLNNAIDALRFRFAPAIREKRRNQLGVESSTVIGIVANFSDHKNPMGVVDIFKAITELIPDAILLWIGDGGMRTVIEERLQSYGISNKAKLIGVRDDVDELLQSMDAFILPSFYEGLPVVMVEAQAAGLRCFASTNVTTEADLTGRCTFLPSEDCAQWAKAIAEADLKHVDTYDQIVRAGYDINTTATWLQGFYLKLSERPLAG